jgi:predicted DNA-binding ribbon-helix-helix protein
MLGGASPYHLLVGLGRVTHARSKSLQLIMTDAFGTSVERHGCFNMQSTVLKRSVVIGRHKTSVSLEGAFWSSLGEIAASRQTTKSGLLTEINERREAANLSSAVRLFVLQHYQDRARS